MKILYYVCISHKTKIIVQNEEDKKIIQSITRPSVNIEKINGSGVDLDEFKYTHPLNEDVTYFLYVGRLIRDKGVHHYLEAAEKLKRKYGKEIEFHLVGPLGVKNSSAIKDAELDHYLRGKYVTYHGYQHDIRLFLKKCDCLVLPSIREGTSKIILEASAIGRPTICFNVPGCNNIIDNGLNGLMTKTFNSDGLAEQLETFLELSHFDRFQLGKNARRVVEDKFCMTKVNAQYISFVGGLI
jgi:glycosyltransferase involved in cell wall biosynthesis